jgi:Tfp pilus assembly protein PilN
MLEVNLLDTRGTRTVPPHRPRMTRWLSLAGPVVTLAALLGAGERLARRDRALDAALAAIGHADSRVRGPAKRASALASRRDRLLRELNAGTGPATPRVADVLTSIARVVPPDVRLRSLSVREHVIQLEGEAPAVVSVARLLEGLNAAPAIAPPVELVESRTGQGTREIDTRLVVRARVARSGTRETKPVLVAAETRR